MIPQAMHVGTADVPWVENVAYPGTWFRLLQADLSVGLYTMHGRMGAGLAVGTHRHHGAVTCSRSAGRGAIWSTAS